MIFLIEIESILIKEPLSKENTLTCELIKLIDLPSLGDERGSLVAIEGNKNIPYKKIFFLLFLASLFFVFYGALRDSSVNDFKGVSSANKDSEFSKFTSILPRSEKFGSSLVNASKEVCVIPPFS